MLKKDKMLTCCVRPTKSRKANIVHNASIDVIRRSSIIEMGIDSQQTSIIHFILFIASMKFIIICNVFSNLYKKLALPA